MKPVPRSWFAAGVRPLPLTVSMVFALWCIDETRAADDSLPAFKYVGSAACSAGGCHGGAGSVRPQGSEFSIWTQQDVHARAFARLLEEPSRRMAERLGLAAAHESDRCLSCHSLRVASNDVAAGQRLAVRSMKSREGIVCTEGVNCELCHGPAENWLEPHKQAKTWAALSAKHEELGFRDTRSLVSRAKLCAGCHVGSIESGREVDHDLIAAGHPRLRFEFNSYLANMPAHWTPRADRHPEHAPDPNGFVAAETSTWAVGQFVSAALAEKLIGSRSPTDFAHFDCHACHHELKSPNWRQQFGSPTGRPGTPMTGAWYSSQLKLIDAALTGREVDRDFSIDVMRQLTIDRPRELAARSWTHADALRLMNGLAVEGAQLSARTWESTSQVYLAMDAVTRDLWRNHEQLDPASGAAASETAAALKCIRKHLEFPGRPVPLDSPRDFDAERVKEIHEQFERIRQAWSATTAAKGR